MACSVAVAGASPVFSPSHRKISLTCKASPEALTLSPDLHAPGGLPSAAAASSSSSSSSSPYRLRLPPGGSGLRSFYCKEVLVSVDSSGEGCAAAVVHEASSPTGAGTSTVLKRKRPTRIHIPPMRPLDFASRLNCGEEEVEQESSRFSVFCKRGKKRREMEDRYKASSDGQGGSQMVRFLFLFSFVADHVSAGQDLPKSDL